VAPLVDRPFVVLENSFNFRDVGDLPTVDGRRVRTGMVFRADGLNRLDDADVAALAPIGLRTVVDLRTNPERDDHGVAPEALGATVYHLPVIEVLWPHDGADEAHPVDYLVDRYLEMTTGVGAFAISGVLRLLSQVDPEHCPAVFHCSAGKDRTGVVAAILLSVLGVHDDLIADDYHRTAAAMERLVEWVRRMHPDAVDSMADQPDVFLSCPTEAMSRFLGCISEQHGSTLGYVRSIGVTDDEIASLRARLVA
jgi:protein-tyrosine phosphatase